MLSEEEKKAVDIVKNITEDDLLNYWEGPEEPYNAIQTVLNLIENQQKELDKKDKIIRKIIQRLENDIQNITKTKADGHTDDYRRCRLKAYKTKTREIKEYIEKEYFAKKVEK